MVAVFIITLVVFVLLLLLVLPLIETQVAALFNAMPAIIAQIETNWLPWIVNTLGIEDSSNLGLTALLERYGDTAGDWAGTILLSDFQIGWHPRWCADHVVSGADPDVLPCCATGTTSS